MMKQVCGINLEQKDINRTEFISSLKGRKIALYGAGGIGCVTCGILKEKGCGVQCFVDDDRAKQGTYVDGIKVEHPDILSQEDGFIILICLPNPMEVYHRLLSRGCGNVQYYPVMMVERDFYNAALLENDREKIERVYGLLSDDFSRTVFTNILKHRATMDFSCLDGILSPKQYFPTDLFTLDRCECFVDGGVYNGETIADFISITENSFSHIYGFEPDRQNYEKFAPRVTSLSPERISLYNMGLYSINGESSFNGNGSSSSSICDTGRDKVMLAKLDDVVGEHIPTYIKLDIEGAEEEALYGMKNTIEKHRPKLAISIYHKAADLWELPLLLHSLETSYRLYIRHYSNGLHETVCYAL
ncbi:hypothetical protein CLHUN_18570 [Ruminiclostridium hungatei]|uniref:Methyltransferase FkbM domain-containing protein n=1 Tax=Ruminiclostridium hungatei TaxID=48256 RepID=A0A1V4SK70_RUMHU|nr:FkbM family methyltransferase [Ruminiclostridium hungatei]OPX44302.1 hypothetical protein CLHUN_18570 [Ruminiclostridium hungatei]